MVLSFFSTNHLAIVKNKIHLLGSSWCLWEGTSHKLYQPRCATFSKIYPKNSPPQSITFIPPAKHLCYRELHFYLSPVIWSLVFSPISPLLLFPCFFCSSHTGLPSISQPSKFPPQSFLLPLSQSHMAHSLSSFRFLLIDYLLKKAAFKHCIEIATLLSPLTSVLFTVQICLLLFMVTIIYSKR